MTTRRLHVPQHLLELQAAGLLLALGRGHVQACQEHDGAAHQGQALHKGLGWQRQGDVHRGLLEGGAAGHLASQKGPPKLRLSPFKSFLFTSHLGSKLGMGSLQDHWHGIQEGHALLVLLRSIRQRQVRCHMVTTLLDQGQLLLLQLRRQHLAIRLPFHLSLHSRPALAKEPQVAKANKLCSRCTGFVAAIVSNGSALSTKLAAQLQLPCLRSASCARQVSAPRRARSLAFLSPRGFKSSVTTCGTP